MKNINKRASAFFFFLAWGQGSLILIYLARGAGLTTLTPLKVFFALIKLETSKLITYICIYMYISCLC